MPMTRRIDLLARVRLSPADFLAARTALGLSQARLAHIMGVGEHAIQSWEVGRRPIPQWAERMLALLAERNERSDKEREAALLDQQLRAFERAGRVVESFPAITRPERAQKGARQ